MTAESTKSEDDQNLRRAIYTTDGGWSPAVAFADHLSIAAPALAEVDGTLYGAHRGARQGDKRQLPVRWTSFSPASVQPYVDALDEANKSLPEKATDGQTEQWQKKLKAAADAREWAPDQNADRIESAETPALVNDNGTLRMVFTWLDQDRRQVAPSSLWETYLTQVGGKPAWARPCKIEAATGMPLAPARAVFNDTVHLVYADLTRNRAGHLVLTPEGTWLAPTTPTGERVEGPGTAYVRDGAARVVEHYGWQGNHALAVHDGQLHLVMRTEIHSPNLSHSVFDGTSWTQTKSIQFKDGSGSWPLQSLRSVALASYDGKLHAVSCPPRGGDKLFHLPWTKADHWSRPVLLDGHRSNNIPALLLFNEGPAGAQREHLLLVRRGIDRYVPGSQSDQPEPPSIKDVESQGKSIDFKGDFPKSGNFRFDHIFTDLEPGTYTQDQRRPHQEDRRLLVRQQGRPQRGRTRHQPLGTHRHRRRLRHHHHLIPTPRRVTEPGPPPPAGRGPRRLRDGRRQQWLYSNPVAGNPVARRTGRVSGRSATRHDAGESEPAYLVFGASKRTERTSRVSLAGWPCAFSRHSGPLQFAPR
ncbi:hypothetical protein [Streptomyces goshikiensis]|uniref:hypothetical protein n=1 Tax=Streptomyces goshikiensis TaxID=1942 RepID=UPI00364609FC